MKLSITEDDTLSNGDMVSTWWGGPAFYKGAKGMADNSHKRKPKATRYMVYRGAGAVLDDTMLGKWQPVVLTDQTGSIAPTAIGA